MTGPEIKPFAGYYSYNTLSRKITSENLLLIGAEANLKTGTTISAAAGSFMQQGEKPMLEIKASQLLFKAGNINFKAQTRGRFKTDGSVQLRGALNMSCPLNSGVTPFAAAHFTTKDGMKKLGGWFGVSYKNVSAEIQIDRGLRNHKTDVMANFMFNI